MLVVPRSAAPGTRLRSPDENAPTTTTDLSFSSSLSSAACSPSPEPRMHVRGRSLSPLPCPCLPVWLVVVVVEEGAAVEPYRPAGCFFRPSTQPHTHTEKSRRVRRRVSPCRSTVNYLCLACVQSPSSSSSCPSCTIAGRCEFGKVDVTAYQRTGNRGRSKGERNACVDGNRRFRALSPSFCFFDDAIPCVQQGRSQFATAEFLRLDSRNPTRSPRDKTTASGLLFVSAPWTCYARSDRDLGKTRHVALCCSRHLPLLSSPPRQASVPFY